MRKPTLRSRLDGVFNVLGFNHRKSRKAIKSSRRTLAVEPLECRQLLSVAPLGNEALVNSLVAGTQRLYETGNAVAAGPNGSYVTTWTSANQDGDGLGVYGQRFDAVGGTLGSEFRANTTTVHNQQRSSVATAADGSFVVVWDSSGQDGDDTGVYGQRYAANGATLGGEFRVNVTTDGSQENAAVACLTDGGFVVVWNGKGAGDNSGVFGRRYDSSGTAVGGEFLINAHTDDQQRYATVAALPDGGFLAAWESHGGQDGDGSGIYAQRFSADGSHVGGEFLVNTTTAHQQQYPAIGVAADGQFTIAWQSSLQDGSGWGVYAQRYQANGQTQGGEFRANSYTTDDQSHPSVAYNHRGGFVIAWNGKGTGDSNGVFVREFGADGAALGSEALVNGTTDDAQRFPTVVAAGSGYVMAWSGDGVGDSDGVFVRRLGSRPTTSGITDESVWAGRSESNIDLWSAFEDAESADSMLTYQVTANSNPDLFSSITIDAATGRLTLGYALGALGSADLTVQAMDPSGLSVETTFVATVAVPEDDPYLWYFPRNGNHVWDTTTQNWNTAADGSGDWRAWPNNASWSAAFGRSADTVTVASDITAGVVTFDVAGYTLNGGSIKLAGTGSTINAANAGGTINSNITVTTDNQEWTVWSGKQLTLGGTVTFSTKTVYIEGGGTAAFTGSTTHNGLSLRIRDGVTAAFSAGSLHVSSLYVGYGSTGTLNWNSSGTLASDNVVSVSASSGTGTINQSAGQVVSNTVGQWGLIYEGNNGHYALSGGTLQVAKLEPQSYTGSQLNLSGSGVLQAAADLTSSNLANLPISLSGVPSIDTNAHSIALPEVISGSGSLTKTGSGTLTLSGANNYTGTTTINAGTLRASGGSNRLPSSTAVSLANASGAVLDLNGQSQTVASLSGGGASGGNVTLGSGTLTVGDSSSATFGGVLSGTGGSLVKQGSGALTLSGANTYTGTTTISQGTLIASSIVVSGGSSSLGNATSPVVLGDGIHQGLLSYTGSSATYTRGFTINAGGGEIDVTNSGQTVTVTTGAIGDSGPLTIGGAGSTSISVAISGTVALTKVGTGTLTLGASNSYSGTTRITAGTLVLNSPLALQSSTLDLNSTDSGSLSFGSLTTATFAGLTGSRNLILQNATSAAVALTVGNGVADTSYSGVLSGAGSLIKVGSNTLTLSANQSYTGPTTAQAGRLNVLGNLSSHVTVTGGTVIGLIFYDPDLAAAVRQALGMSVNTVLTAANVSPLTSLSVDSNRVTTLQGLQYATNLESLTLLPGDFSSNASYEHLPSTSSSTSPLAPLSGLTHLTTLILQDCGLNDTALTTSVSLPSLQSLDIRYNSISTVPSWIASLSGFTSLLVYGNTALTSNPRIGLANLAGKLINVDVAPDHPEAATTIADLAASLYHLPIAMYQYVTNTIEFQPYTGAMKGALAVLQTGGGNDWDTDSLLAELFQDAGVSTQHISRISGRVTVSDQTAEDYLGVTNASAAVAVLDAAGLEPTTGTGTITFDHAWLQVTFGSTTVKLDPAWKFCDFQPGMGDMLASQSFDLDDYLSTVTKETAGEYYEQQVRDYLAANDPSKTIADVPHTGPIHQQTITSLLTDLPYQHTQGTVVTTVPEHQIQISMVIPCWTYVGGSWHWDHITGTYDAGSNTTTLSAEKWNGSDWVEDSGVFSYGSVGTKVYIDFSNTGTWQNAQAFNVVSWNSLSSITVSGNAPATDAQFYITGVSELYGVPDISLDKVTLGYVGTSNSLTPDLRLTDTTGESTDVYGNKTLPNGAPVNIIITYYQPTSSGSTQRYSTTYPRYAGDYAAIGIDAGQLSDRWIVAARKTLNDAEVAKSDNPGSAIQDDSIVRGLLSLAVADYFHQTDQEEAIIDGLTGAVPVYNFVASCLASSASTLQTADFSQQLPYLPASMSIDVQNNFCDAVAINGSDPSAVTRFNLVGYNDSAAESALWEELTNIPSASTVKAIQYANQNGIDIAPFGPGSTRQQIYDQFSLISDTNFRNGLADSIHSYCQAGYSVDSPTQIMSFGNDQSQPWTGVGFTVADSAGRVLAYMIYGGVSGSSQYATVSGGAAVGPPSIVYDVVSAVVSLLATDPVNTANGDVVYQATDFSIPNLGVPLTFARQYDSFNTVSGLAGAPSPWSDRGMGEGWSFSFSDTLTTSTDVNDPSGTKVWFASDGVQYKFVPNGGGYNTPKTLFGTLVFNGSGQGYTWTDKNDNVIHFDDSGKLRYEWDVYGNGVDIAYDGNGCITTVSDHVNSSRHLTFTYTSGHITSIVDFNGRTWTYRYTGGQLTQVTTPTDVNTPQGSTAYGYYSDDAQRNLLKSVLDADGNTTTFEYYSNRYGFRVIDADGGAYSLSYNLFRNRTALTCALGSTGYYSYDVDTGHALLTERLYADRTTNTYQWTDGLMTSDTDAYGQTQSYTYYNDGTGDLHTYTDRGNNVTTYTYTADVYHNIASIATTGPNGNVVTTFTYNANSGKSLTDVTEDSSGLALHTTFTYQGSAGARGLPDTMTSPNGYLTSGDPNDYKTTYTYNIAGDVLTESYRVSSTHSITEQYGYDNWGNLTSYTDGNGKVTSYTYDLLDRVKTETDPDPDGTGGLPAPHVTYAYNGNGDLIQKSVDTAGTTPLVTTITYDAMENVTGVTNPDGTYTSYAYDQGENLVRQTDELGRATRYLYDRRYRQIATIAPDGGVWRTSYDGGNRVVAETDALGNTTRYEYDVLGQLTEVVSPDPDGNGSLTSLITLYGYYNDGSLRYVTDTHADVNGNPVASLGDANYTTEYHYDNLGQLTQEIDADPDGNGSLGRPTTYYGYDADGNLAWTTDARGSAAQDPDHTTTYNYDEAGRLIRVNVPDPNGASGDKLTTRYFYDDNGNVTDVVDPRGTDAKEAAYTTHYVYDALGRLTQEVDPDPDDFSNVGGSNGPQTRPSTSYAYDAYGNLASVTDPLTHTTSYQYDKLGQCTAVTDALGDTNSVLYDAAGNVLWSKDALGAITFYQYDAADQMVSVTLPAANADTSAATTTYQYDLNGNLTSATDALEHTTTYQYDRLGRRTQVTSPNTGSNTSVTQYAYDSQGRLLSTTDGLSYATTYAYDNLNRLTSETDALNGVTSYTYDANGNTLSVEDPDGNTTEYAYDSLNRVTDSLDRGASESDPLALTRQYQYDDIGNVTQYTDRDFRVTKYQYDNLGRETGEQWMSGATVVHSFSYAYDALGRLLSGSDNDPTYGSTDSYVYNALGQVTSETQAIDGLTPSVTLSRQYDANGRQTQLSAAIGSTSDFVNDYAYDRLGELAQVKQHGATVGDAVAEKRVDFTYNAVGQFSTIARYNALAGGSGNEVATSVYGYDAAGRLTSLTHTHGSTTLAGYEWTYDAANRMTEMKSKADATAGNDWGVVDYTYDATDQLKTATYSTWANAPSNENYGYDANGNRNTGGNTVQSTGDNRQATDSAGYTYSYDNEGNRVARFIDANANGVIDSGDSEITTYQWDYRNRLTEVEYFASAANYGAATPISDLVVSYTYDYANRLIKEVVDSDGTSGSTAVKQTVFAYDGIEAVLQFEKTGTGALAGSNLSDRYLWGPAIDQILTDEQVTSLGTAGTNLWGLADHEGTVRDILDNSGSVTDHRVFDSFGKMTSHTGSADFDIGYAGMFYDSGSGMNRTLFRLYDPAVGRWANQDPLGLAAGPNPYAYCGNSPMTHTDPIGLKTPTIGSLSDGSTDADVQAVIRGILDSEHPSAGLRIMSGAYFLQNEEHAREQLPDAYRGAATLPANDLAGARYFIFPRFISRDLKSTLVYLRKAYDEQHLPGPVVMEFGGHAYGMGGFSIGAKSRQQLKGVKDVQHYVDETNAAEFAQALLSAGFHPRVIILSSCNLNPKIAQIIADKTGATVIYARGFAKGSFVEDGVGASSTKRYDKTRETLRENTTSEIAKIENKLKERGLSKEDRDSLVRERNDLKNRLKTLIKDSEAGWGIARPREKGTTKPDNRTDKQSLTRPTVFQTAGCY